MWGLKEYDQQGHLAKYVSITFNYDPQGSPIQYTNKIFSSDGSIETLLIERINEGKLI